MRSTRSPTAISAAKERTGPSRSRCSAARVARTKTRTVWSMLAKGVIGTDNVDAQLGDGLPAEFVLGMPRAEIADFESARAIVLLDHDLATRFPCCSCVCAGPSSSWSPAVDLAPVGHTLSDRAAFVARTVPGEPVAADVRERIVQATEGRAGPIVVVIGRGNLAARPDAVARAARPRCATLPDVRFLSALRRGNVHGALDVGIAPGFLPGRVTLDAGREWFGAQWGGVPEHTGLDAEGILRGAADGQISVLVLLGADPITDFPDATLARQALAAVETIIAVDAFRNDSRRARGCLPAMHAVGREGGHRHEPRRPRAAPRPQGRARRHGNGRLAHRGRARAPARRRLRPRDRRRGHRRDRSGRAGLRRRRRGAAAIARATASSLPLRDHRDEIVLRTRDLSIMADDGSGTSWDPIKVEPVRCRPTRPRRSTPPNPRPRHPTCTCGDASAPSPAAPGRDAYALRLVVGRALYDDGRIVDASRRSCSASAPGTVCA